QHLQAGEANRSVHAEALEGVLLGTLLNVKPAQLHGAKVDTTAQLSQALEACNRKIGQLTEMLLTTENPALALALEKLGNQSVTLQSQLETAKREKVAQQANTLAETHSLIEHLAGLKGEALTEARTALKGQIAAQVARIVIEIHTTTEASVTV